MPKMTPERWQRVTAMLAEVLPADPGRREALLAELCGDDEDLRREVASLLSYEAQRVSVLEEPLAPWHPASRATTAVGGEPDDGDRTGDADESGLRIGPYRVLTRLGAGASNWCSRCARRCSWPTRTWWSTATSNPATSWSPKTACPS